MGDNEDPMEEFYDGWAVVLNHEEQYSIWDTIKPFPDGWRAEGFKGAPVPTGVGDLAQETTLTYTNRHEKELLGAHRESVG